MSDRLARHCLPMTRRPARNRLTHRARAPSPTVRPWRVYDLVTMVEIAHASVLIPYVAVLRGPGLACPSRDCPLPSLAASTTLGPCEGSHYQAGGVTSSDTRRAVPQGCWV